MAAGATFPVFLQGQFNPGTAFAELTQVAGRAGRQAGAELERGVKGSVAEITRIVSQALTMPANSTGAFDLGVPQMRAAAQAAEQRAAALRQVATAASALAAKEVQLTGAQQAYIVAANAAAAAAERDVLAERERIGVLEQVQGQMNAAAMATGRYAAASRTAATAAVSTSRSVGQQRAAYQQLGFQIQDVTMQMGLGINPLVILAQQGGQTAFAISQFGGVLGRVGGFLSGPWGAAILGGVTILGLLASRTSEAAATQTNLADAADTLGHAQGLLGNFIDLTTGKQTSQNEVMREAIRLQALLAQMEAVRAGREAGLRLAGMRPDAFRDARGRSVSRATAARGAVLGDGTDISGSAASAGLQANPGVQDFQRLIAGFRSNRAASVRTFRESLEGMARRGELGGVDVNAAMREALTIASGRNEVATMADVRRVAEGGALPSYLRRPSGGGSRSRSGRQPTDQTEFGEDAGARIANITSRFVDAPAQVEAVRRAMSELNDVASDLERRRPPNYTALTAQLATARVTVQDGLLAPYREFLEQQDQGLALQRLINSGRTEEAETLQEIARIEEQVGKLDETQRDAIARRIELRAEEARMAEIERERQSAYLRTIDETRSLLEGTLANLGTRGLSSIGDLASGFQQSFNVLNASSIIEGLFGGTFRELEDVVTGRGRVRAANEEQAEASDVATSAIKRLGDAAGQTAAAMTDNAGQIAGLIEAGNIDILNRPRHRNADGSISTVRSMSFGTDRGEVLVPTISDRGRPLSDRQAISQYESTGRHLGIFDTPEHATAYAEALHQQQEAMVAAQDATTHFSTGLTDLNAVIASLQDRVTAATESVGQWAEAAGDAANDNDNIVVTGRRTKKGAEDDDPTARLSPNALFARTLGGLVGQIFGGEEGAIKMGKIVGKYMADALEGSAYGQMAGGLVLGSGGSRTGSAIGGALGNIAGKEFGSVFKDLLGNFGGQFAGPLGSIVGGVLGGLAGNLLTSTPRATSTIGMGSDGRLAVTGSTGTKSLQGQTSTAADSVLSTVMRIADMFGASVDPSRGAVSIGVRDGNYRVDTSGRGVTKTKKGAIDFGEDAEAAVRAAALDLIKDGVITGLRQGTQTLLRDAKDIDSGIEKALRFEGVFTRLKERLDPVGAALDALDKEFSGLRRVFEEAGASAADMADLEKLYSLQRVDAIKEAGERMTSALRGLIEGLTVNNEAFSLRDRLTNARAKFDPLAARVAAGDTTVDYDAFAEAARTVADLMRQMGGSQSPYFSAIDEILRLSNKALAEQQGRIDQATGRPPAIAPPSHDNGPVVDAISGLGDYIVGSLGGILSGQLSAVNANLGTLVRQTSGSGGGGGFPELSNVHNF
jgi:hypothetical protein